MNNKAAAVELFSSKYDEWINSQIGQTSAYEYEKSYDLFVQQLTKELLQISVGAENHDRKKKLYKLNLE